MIAAVNIHLFVLALIALVGLCFYLNLDRSARWRPLVSSLFALGMLFLGLELMRSGSHDLNVQDWTRGLFETAAQSSATALLLGTVFAAIAQSSATVSVIVVAMASAGLLNLEQASFVVLGASIGSGIATYFIGFRILGQAAPAGAALGAVQDSRNRLAAAAVPGGARIGHPTVDERRARRSVR